MSRVSRTLFVVIVVGVCGGVALSAPGAPGGKPDPVTCADAGGLLARKFASYDDAMVDKHEAEITKACTDGKWPQAVLDCLGDAPIDGQSACFDKLSHEQQVALVGSVTQARPPEPPPPPPSGDDDDKFTPCAAAVGDAASFGAPLPYTGDDAVFALQLRKLALVGACGDDGWTEHAKECFAAAKDAGAIATCTHKLADHAQTGVTTAVTGAADLATKTFDARKTAAGITCAKVVTKHYADATWKDKLTKIKPADKKAAIAASRTRMTKACGAEKWSPTLRACTLSGGEFPACAATPDVNPWGFPAFGVVAPTGIPACDKYLGTMVKLAECPKAKDMREALLSSVSSATSTLSELPAESREVVADACKQGMELATEQASELGCPL